MYKRMTIYSLPEGTDGNEFWKYHTQVHAVDVMKASGQWRKKYVINRASKPLYGASPFFGLVETWWESKEMMEKDMEALQTTRLSNGKTVEEDFLSRVTGAYSVLVEETIVME